MKEKQVAKLGNRSFGLSRDEFLKSVKKFLVKKVRTIPFNSRSRPPPAPLSIPQSFVINGLFHDARSRSIDIFGIDGQSLFRKCKRSL